MSAQPIQSSKRLILVYGPDSQLRQIAALVRAANPDATVNLRSTDNNVEMADAAECDRRIIVDSPNGAVWAAAYERAGLPIERVKFVGGKLIGMDEEPSAPFVLEAPAPKPLTLWDGRVVDRDEALQRVSAIYNVDHQIMSAWTEEQLEEMINGCYDVQCAKPEPQPEPEVKPKKKKGK